MGLIDLIKRVPLSELLKEQNKGLSKREKEMLEESKQKDKKSKPKNET